VLLAELIAAGEIQVGLTVYNANAESLKRKGAPIDWLPVQPVVARPQGIAVARNAPTRKRRAPSSTSCSRRRGRSCLVSMGRVPASTRVRTHLNDFEYTVVDPITVLDEQDKWGKLWEELFIRGEGKR
jgi:iron(III) transport system substrate-binding protein